MDSDNSLGGFSHRLTYMKLVTHLLTWIYIFSSVLKYELLALRSVEWDTEDGYVSLVKRHAEGGDRGLFQVTTPELDKDGGI
jgi:hypothetical protein